MTTRTYLAVGMLALGALTFAAEGCTGEPSGEVTSNHTEAEFTHRNSPYFWAAGSYEAFRQSDIGLSLPEPALDDTHPITLRLQTWIDRLDAVVRQSHREQTGEELVAPKPIAKVLPSRTMFNAFVSGVYGCVAAPFDTPDPEGGDGSDLSVALLYNVAQPPWVGSFACQQQEGWTAAGLSEFWNGGAPACTLQQQGLGLGTSSECTSFPATSVGTIAASPFIHFSTDLLGALDEDAVVVVAAHELGHYYRAHTSPLVQNRYGFWYDQQPGQPVRPLPAADQERLRDAYLDIIWGPSALGGPLYKGHYSARLLFYLMGTVRNQIRERFESDFVCAKARDLLGPWVFDLQSEGSWPLPESLAKYQRFEEALVACAPELKLGEAGPNSLSAGALLFGAKLEGPGGSVTMKWGDTLATFLARLDAQARKLDDKAERLQEHLRSNRIGWYTTEQEADDMALDLATRVGLSPERVLSGWLGFMRAADARLESNWTPEELASFREKEPLDAAACQKLMEADFSAVDESGRRRPVMMNLGDLHEPHHASCYRLYRLWSETKAHRYSTAPALPSLEPAWSVLRGEAQELGAMPLGTVGEACFSEAAGDVNACVICVGQALPSDLAERRAVMASACLCANECADACVVTCSDNAAVAPECDACLGSLTAESQCAMDFSTACQGNAGCLKYEQESASCYGP